MLAVLGDRVEPGTEVVAVEEPFAVPLIDQDTGEVLDRDLVGTLDLLERDAEGRLAVVDLRTAARKYTDLQVEASLQLSIYSYATSMNGLADQEDRTSGSASTSSRRRSSPRSTGTGPRGTAPRTADSSVAEVLHVIEAGVFHPNPGWHCKDCTFRSRCWAWG
jgi:RecB family exonuclease